MAAWRALAIIRDRTKAALRGAATEAASSGLLAIKAGHRRGEPAVAASAGVTAYVCAALI